MRALNSQILFIIIFITIFLKINLNSQSVNLDDLQIKKFEKTIIKKLVLDKEFCSFEYVDLNKDKKKSEVIIHCPRESYIYKVNTMTELWHGPAYCSLLSTFHKGYRDIEASYFGVTGVSILKWNGIKYE